MLYFLAIFLPPVAVLLCGKPLSALLNVLLCCFLWIPGIIHAFAIVNEHKNDKRMQKLAKSLRA